jgi:sodium transport system permease protein
MSRWKAAWTVFAKELVDALRDRRTLVVVFLSSVAMGPLVLVLLSSLVDQFEKRAEAREIVTVGIEHAPTLRNYLERQTYEIRSAPADFEARLKDNKLGDPVVVIPPTFESELAHGEAPRLELIFSSSNGRAQSGMGRIMRLLQGFQQERIGLRMIERGVAPALLNVARVEEHDVADSAARAAQLTGMLPFFVLMAVVYGSLNAALDTTAGERERGSLEPLLATPAARRSLVVGKWGAVFCVGLLIAMLSCLSFVPGQILLRSESLAALFRFGWGEAVRFVGLLAPLAAALSASMMAIAIRCRTFKEAQANTTVVVLVVSLMPIMTLFNQEGEAAWHLWVPALAQMTLMSRVLKGVPVNAADVLPGVFVCAAIAILALAWITRQLARRAAQ